MGCIKLHCIAATSPKYCLIVYKCFICGSISSNILLKILMITGHIYEGLDGV